MDEVELFGGGLVRAGCDEVRDLTADHPLRVDRHGHLANGLKLVQEEKDKGLITLIVRDKPLPAQIVTLPFVPHRYIR